jgi:hypothetical protein
VTQVVLEGTGGIARSAWAASVTSRVASIDQTWTIRLLW